MIIRRTILLFASLLFAFTTTQAQTPTLALVGGTVYTSPSAPALHDAVILSSNGTITTVGKRSSISVPKDAQVIDCSGKTIVAGFWNSHVHFTEPVWTNAANAAAAPLAQHMQEMLNRWGFTTVWDLGSTPADSLALRSRVDSGEIPGPQIFLAGDIFPKGGHPAYLPAAIQLPEAASSEEATKMAHNYLNMGLDGIKLFTGAFMGDKPVINMDTSIVKAAVTVAHAHGKPVFAHPQNRTGLDNAITGGVDILAHTIPSTEFSYSTDELERFQSQHTALVPTLTLWTTISSDKDVTDKIVQLAASQLKAFAANGGPILFGTDVGFIQVYDTSLEFEFMHRALSTSEVLASLTTNPATYFHATKKGQIQKGFDADFAVLEGDPVSDIHNLAQVAYTIRAGHIIYKK